MDRQPPTSQELESMANAIADQVLARLAQALSGTVHSATFDRRVLPENGDNGGALGYACTGMGFTCGTYTCTGTVGCTGNFGCTVKFAG